MTTTDAGTDLAIFDGRGAALEFRYSPTELRRWVEHLDEMRRGILQDGTDYSVIPGTQKPTLLKPGAEKLLMAAGLGFTIERIPEPAADSRAGVTYRTSIKRGEQIVAQCDGYAGYDEDRFFQTATQAQAKAERRERAYAAKDRRAVNSGKFDAANFEDYKAPWNSVMKMAEKRSLVGAVLNALAASGLFTQDLEDMASEDQLSWDVGELLKPWLRQVYELDGGREALRTWTAENGYPERPKDFNQAQATALLVQIGRILERSDGAPDPKASMPVTSSPGGSAKPAENMPANIPAPVVAEEDDGRPFDTEPGEPVDEAAPVDVATGEISADELAKRRGWGNAQDERNARTAAQDVLTNRKADGRITSEAANAAWGEYGDHPTSDEHDAWVAKHLPVITPEVAEDPLAAGAERTPPGPSPSVLAAGGTSKRPSPLAAVRDAREQLARTAAATEAAEAEGLPF